VRPVILKFKNVPSIYVRREGFTNGATYEEIISMSIASHNAAYDTLPSDQEYRREDFEGLLEFHRAHSDGRELTDKALRSLGFFDGEGRLANGATLFRDGCVDPKTSVQCSVFSGLTKGSERIVTVNRYAGPLTVTIDYMLEFVRQRMNYGMVKLPSSRIDIDAFPERALFEGIVNAVAHRDYFLDGTQIQVDMFADRLEISSPGSFFQGESLRKTYDLSSIISKRRNELICGVLVSCGVMEAAGTGFDKVAEDYRDADEGHRPFIFSTSDHFTLVLPDLTYGNGVADAGAPPLVFAPVPNGSAHDGAILSACYATARTAGEIAQVIGLSDSSYFRKRILGNLVEHGYLDKSAVGRAAYYRTNGDAVALA
jgi:predicted HTH transcriptional regulator